MVKVVNGYKGFDNNLMCRDFQYEIGKKYCIGGDISCCERGFHACDSPLEVWDYYFNFGSRFAEVEQSGTFADEKHLTLLCSSKIKVKKELSLQEIVKLGFEWVKENATKTNGGESFVSIDSLEDFDKISLTGQGIDLYSEGKYAQISCSSFGNNKIRSFGKSAKISSLGECGVILSKGEFAKIYSSGDFAYIYALGYIPQVYSSGCSAEIFASLGSAKVESVGDYAKISTSGASTKIMSSGKLSQVFCSGDYSEVYSEGESSIVSCTGKRCVARAKVGSSITLAEYDDKGNLKNVKTEKVDGVRIKEDTWYKIHNGEFEEDKKTKWLWKE